jgi:hypothetical protein
VFGNLYMLAAKVGDRLVNASYDTGPASTSVQTHKLSSLVKSMRPRALFDLPTGQGVCLPYLFIHDAGASRRHVDVSFRLNDHPDIQVTLKDASAAMLDPGVRTKNAEPEPTTVSF